jgi:hypothetical protein
MNWGSFENFLDMGGYAWFVWGVRCAPPLAGRRHRSLTPSLSLREGEGIGLREAGL